MATTLACSTAPPAPTLKFASDAGVSDAPQIDGVAVSEPEPATADTTSDAGLPDAGPPDAGLPDAGPPDAGLPDAGLPDAGPPDAEVPNADASTDTVNADVAADAGAFDADACSASPNSCSAPAAACKTTTQGTDNCGNTCSKVGPPKCFKVHPACITAGPGTLTDAADCLTPYGKYNCGLSCQEWPNELGADCTYCTLVKCVKKSGKDEAQFKCKNLPVPPTP